MKKQTEHQSPTPASSPSTTPPAEHRPPATGSTIVLDDLTYVVRDSIKFLPGTNIPINFGENGYYVKDTRVK